MVQLLARSEEIEGVGDDEEVLGSTHVRTLIIARLLKINLAWHC
jgi:hypothetical protein